MPAGVRQASRPAGRTVAACSPTPSRSGASCRHGAGRHSRRGVGRHPEATMPGTGALVSGPNVSRSFCGVMARVVSEGFADESEGTRRAHRAVAGDEEQR